MWFNELMDDCKHALSLVWSNPWIALPYVLQALLIGIIAGGLAVVFILMFVVGAIGASNNSIHIWGMIIPFLIGLPLITLLFSSLAAMVDAGSISLFARVVEGHRPNSALFWEGVGRHFLPMWGIRLFLGALVLILSPLLALLVIIFSVTVGILSGGWGMIVIPVLSMVFFAAWPMALILDGQGGFKALKAGIRLGRNYFWGMFVLALAATLVGQHLSTAFGPILTIIIGWVIAILVNAWFKMTVLLIFRRRSA
jgi:hypothetical protein